MPAASVIVAVNVRDAPEVRFPDADWLKLIAAGAPTATAIAFVSTVGLEPEIVALARNVTAPAVFRLKPLNAAIPEPTVRLVVPDRVPDPVCLANVMLVALSVVTVLPCASTTATLNGNGSPASTDAGGCEVTASPVAAPAPAGVIVAVTGVNPGEVNVRV